MPESLFSSKIVSFEVREKKCWQLNTAEIDSLLYDLGSVLHDLPFLYLLNLSESERRLHNPCTSSTMPFESNRRHLQKVIIIIKIAAFAI
jgi:hypothetical protein